MWLGPVVNSSARDWKPSLSPNEHSLYFHSNRVGGLGGFDIWVSRRAAPNCPWEAPVDVGPPVNTPDDDGEFLFIQGDAEFLVEAYAFLDRQRGWIVAFYFQKSRGLTHVLPAPLSLPLCLRLGSAPLPFPAARAGIPSA